LYVGAGRLLIFEEGACSFGDENLLIKQMI